MLLNIGMYPVRIAVTVLRSSTTCRAIKEAIPKAYTEIVTACLNWVLEIEKPN